MRIGIVGDIHGDHRNISHLKRMIDISEPDFCLQVGDFRAYEETWEVPLYWIRGNHEKNNGNNALRLDPGIHALHGITVYAIPGIIRQDPTPGPAGADFPLSWFTEYSKTQMPRIDIVLSHGAGYPFWVDGVQCEEQEITHALQTLRPKYAISGHNHMFQKEERDGITLVRLGICSQTGNGYDVIEM